MGIERGLGPNALVSQMRTAVDRCHAMLPVVAALQNAALKDRHWSRMFTVLGCTLPRDETLTLQVRCWSQLLQVLLRGAHIVIRPGGGVI